MNDQPRSPHARMSPVMEQYSWIKAKHPDAILLFHIGDFYETFGADAELVSRELDIVLTSRQRGRDGERIPLAGVPYHAAEGYIARLLEKGHRVAICDQLEDPRTARGLVKRDVVRVITPGTVIDAGLLGVSPAARYLMSLLPDERSRQIGMAFLDISTGEFFATVCPLSDGLTECMSEIAKYRPTECILPEGGGNLLVKPLEERKIPVTPYRDAEFSLEKATETLLSQFQVSTLDGYGCRPFPSAVRAAGACVQFARETQRCSLQHISGMSIRIPGQCLGLDAITLRNLEILESIRGGDAGATLLSLLDCTETPMGSRLLRTCLTAPLISVDAINARLDAVECLANAPLVQAELRTLLHRCADIERIAGRIAYGNAGPRDLIRLRDTLRVLPDLQALGSRIVQGGGSARLRDLVEGLKCLPDTVGLLSRSLRDDPPAATAGGGMIREGYDPRLDELRAMAASGKDWILDLQQRERQETGIRSLKIGYNSVFGYYIEVTRPNLHLVPPHYERKQTTAGGERFTTPELKEKEAMIATAEERLLSRELELYASLLESLRQTIPDLRGDARILAELDVYAALAEVARRNGYVRPILDESTRIEIRDGRHPVVDARMGGGYVPNDTHLDGDGDQILIITGANMAGKSTYMRGVAQIVILAQMGSFVPAEYARIGLVDRIFTRVGAFDDLASGQSTFMVEMLELANILNNLTPRSLVILDEIGRGTSTLDGCSIARAVLEFLHGRASGPRTLFATHFHELVGIETEYPRVKNCHFAVKDTGAEVVFLRKLIPGATDKSYGIHVAQLAGIPRKVIDRARAILKESMERETGPKVRRYTQMLLIDPPAGGVRESALVRALQELDPDSMTPREALLALYDLKEKAGGRER